MTQELKLLTAIGWVKDEYIQEMMEPARARLPKRKLWLVAALVAVSLLLTGCAMVYVLRLENMKVGQTVIPRTRGFETVENTEPVTLNILSLQGIQGSPNYNAAREWYDFRQSYQQELGVQPLTEEEERRYISYACYDRVMADKLDEIVAKYGLKLHGEWFHEVRREDMYNLLGIRDILHTQAQDFYGGGMFFQDGSFRLEGGFTPANCPWPHPVSYSYLYTRKQIFDDVTRSMGDIDSYQQWIYNTQDGEELLLVLGPKDAMIFADQEEAFVSLGITNDDYPTPFSMEKSELEAVAELFDFTIRPQPLDEAKVERARQLQETAIQARMAVDLEVADSYEAYAKNYLLARPWSGKVRMEYTIRDMNGDGTEELVIYHDRMVSDIVTMKEGKTKWFGGNGRPWVWCEGDLFMDCFNYGDYGGDNHDDAVIIRRFEGTKKIDVRQFRHCDSQQWRELDPFTDIPITNLTDEQFQEIMDSYPPIDLDTLNLKPLEILANG